MENLYVTFTVHVSDKEYTYAGKDGKAEAKIQVPRDVLENIDPGNIFVGIMRSAIANFDKPEEEEEEE